MTTAARKFVSQNLDINIFLLELSVQIEKLREQIEKIKKLQNENVEILRLYKKF